MANERKTRLSISIPKRAADFVKQLSVDSGDSQSGIIGDIILMVADSGILEVMNSMKKKQQEQTKEGLQKMAKKLESDLEKIKQDLGEK